MKKFIALFLVLVLPALVGFERESESDFVGEIEKESVVTAEAGAFGVNVSGEGEYSSQTAVIAEDGELVASYGADVAGGDGMLTRMEVIASAKLAGDEEIEAEQVYATRVIADAGETGYLAQYIATENVNDVQTIGSQARISGGVYMRHIDLMLSDVTVAETFEVVGAGETKDEIRFSQED